MKALFSEPGPRTASPPDVPSVPVSGLPGPHALRGVYHRPPPRPRSPRRSPQPGARRRARRVDSGFPAPNRADRDEPRRTGRTGPVQNPATKRADFSTWLRSLPTCPMKHLFQDTGGMLYPDVLWTNQPTDAQTKTHGMAYLAGDPALFALEHEFLCGLV